MPISRFILSAIVLIITNLIVGSISLSLGLIVALILLVVAAAGVLLLAVLGLSVMLEKMNWVRAGWTDAKIERLRDWAGQKWHRMPQWYQEQKNRIIEMLVEMLKGKEASEASNPIKIWKSILVGLILLVAIVVVKKSLNVTMGWSIVIVAVGFSVLAIPLSYLSGRKTGPVQQEARTESRQPMAILPSEVEASAEEIIDALRALIDLHRAGRLKELLQSASPQRAQEDKNA